jgi:signal transduction histidine kinase
MDMGAPVERSSAARADCGQALTERDQSFALIGWSKGLTFEALANLAHELRTPLQVLIGNLEMLREEYASQIGRRPRELVERMNANVLELRQTLDNLIGFVMAKAGSAVDVDETITVESILTDIGPAIDAANAIKRLELHFDLDDAPATIRAPRRVVTATILNLALNAIKFTEAGSVTIAIRQRNEVQGCPIEIEVSDTGPGLSPIMLEQMSQPFAQLSRSSTRRYRGLGLGLTVVSQYVTMLGGRIKLLSRPGRGATFTVWLPSAGGAIEMPAGGGTDRHHPEFPITSTSPTH